MHKDISQLFHSNINAPTTLMELTIKQHERFKDHCIHMSGLYMQKDTPVCLKATYGNAILLSKKKIGFGNIETPLSCQYINLTKTNNR